MSKKRLRKVLIQDNGLIRFRILFRWCSDVESFVKALGDESTDGTIGIHLSIVSDDEGFAPHITYEKVRGPNHHKPLRRMSKEEAMNLCLMIFSTPDAPCPLLSPNAGKKEFDSAVRWLRDAMRRAYRSPKHQKIRVFQNGPLRDLIVRMLNDNSPYYAGLDIHEIGQQLGKIRRIEDDLHWVYEDEVRADLLELGFMTDPERVLFLTPGDMILELNSKSVLDWAEALGHLPGMDEYLDELEKRGIISRSR
ncbi:MAG: hypothetical protein AB1793_00200 [Candidatus Thermoplasmatota archaeon]